MTESRLHAPLPPNAVHLCIDMQNIFAPGAPWETPWLERVVPVAAALAERFRSADRVYAFHHTGVPRADARDLAALLP